VAASLEAGHSAPLLQARLFPVRLDRTVWIWKIKGMFSSILTF